MKTFMAAMLLTTTMLAATAMTAPEAEARGCIRGAVVGGVAGHVAGHHGLLGAAAGCAVGHHMANRRTAAPASDPQYGGQQQQRFDEGASPSR